MEQGVEPKVGVRVLVAVAVETVWECWRTGILTRVGSPEWWEKRGCVGGGRRQLTAD